MVVPTGVLAIAPNTGSEAQLTLRVCVRSFREWRKEPASHILGDNEEQETAARWGSRDAGTL